MGESDHWQAVYCPGEAHRQPVNTPAGSTVPSPKILFLCRPDRSEVLLQCNDIRCRHSERPQRNGWFLVKLKPSGTYTITPMPKQRFPVKTMPGVVFD